MQIFYMINLIIINGEIMSNFILSIDELIRVYWSSKRIQSDLPVRGYDIDKGDFINITDTVREKMENGTLNVIPFINSYKVCLEIIDKYLSQPTIQEYSEGAYEAMKENKHCKILAFIKYFDNIDGTYSFNDFEEKQIKRTVVKWASDNGFELT